MNLPAKLLTELVGTFVFFSVIALVPASGPSAPLAPIATGSALMAMVYMGAHISGAHYNPAVSLGLFLRQKIDATTMVAYWVAQLVGGALAFVAGYLVIGHAGGIHPGNGVFTGTALAVEVLFTAALVLVVLNVAATRATEGNSFYGLAIGFTILAAAYVGGPVSGGAFNPAVGFGATLSAALFAGGSWSSLWLYLVGPLAGGVIGAGVHWVQVTGVAGLEPTPAAPAVQEQHPGS
jgi:aquaporin Z